MIHELLQYSALVSGTVLLVSTHDDRLPPEERLTDVQRPIALLLGVVAIIQGLDTQLMQHIPSFKTSVWDIGMSTAANIALGEAILGYIFKPFESKVKKIASRAVMYAIKVGPLAIMAAVAGYLEFVKAADCALSLTVAALVTACTTHAFYSKRHIDWIILIGISLAYWAYGQSDFYDASERNIDILKLAFFSGTILLALMPRGKSGNSSIDSGKDLFNSGVSAIKSVRSKMGWTRKRIKA